MRKKFSILLFFLLSFEAYAQTYSDIVVDSLINDLLVWEIDNRPKHSDDKNIWKKRISAKPISWTQALIQHMSLSPYDFDFQRNELINRDKQYNLELIPLTELFSQSDFNYMERQFNSEITDNWNFESQKGRIKNRPRKNFYSFSIPLFDETHEKAIIYTEFAGCGGVCGEGKIFVFIKTDKEWKLYKTIPLWMS